MIDSNQTSQAPESKPARTRTSRRPAAEMKKEAPAMLAKSRDPRWTKVTHYLPVELADKLTVATVLRRGCDQSDIITESLATTLSSVTFYDRKERPSLPKDSSLPVSEFGNEAAA
jgi:hypothetical protein